LGIAVVHLGPRPTVDRDESVEAHLIGQTLDLYGSTLRVEFFERLRGLERFGDLDALKHQIQLDVLAARRVFESKG
jgi:riboflavin kinase/FMN adenylyltransferase